MNEEDESYKILKKANERLEVWYDESDAIEEAIKKALKDEYEL